MLEGAGQFAGEQRDVFLVAENVAEGQAHKFDVVVLGKIQHILCSMLHKGGNLRAWGVRPDNLKRARHGVKPAGRLRLRKKPEKREAHPPRWHTAGVLG